MFLKVLNTLLFAVFTGLPAFAWAADDNLVGAFSKGSFFGWEEKEFVGKTTYQLEKLDERTVLSAETDASASGLFLETTIDLTRTPWVNWSWRVDNIYQGLDEKTKQGDDYPARLYVVVSGGLFFWKTRALNYVWSSTTPEGQVWSSAYTKNSRMFSVEGGDKNVGQWRQYKRNIREDLKRAFGKDFTEIHAIALMSDSDNARQSAKAYYGDIFFSAE